MTIKNGDTPEMSQSAADAPLGALKNNHAARLTYNLAQWVVFNI